MHTCIRTIYFFVLGAILISLPTNTSANIVKDTASNVVDFYEHSTNSLLNETANKIKGVYEFYNPLIKSSRESFKGIYNIAFVASDSILNGVISLGRGVMDSSEYSISRTGEGLGNAVASASSVLSKISKSNSVSKVDSSADERIDLSAKNSTASVYAQIGNTDLDFPDFTKLPKQILNVNKVIGNNILDASGHVLVRTGDAWSNSFATTLKVFDVVDRGYMEATVALGNAGYKGVANIFTVSDYISKPFLDAGDFFAERVVTGVTDTSKNIAGVGSFFTYFMDKLSDSLAPLFTDQTYDSNIGSNVVTPPAVAPTTGSVTILPGTNTIRERIIERSSYPVYVPSSVDSLRTELISLNSSTVEYLKGLINRSEYRTSESIYRTAERSGGSNGASGDIEADTLSIGTLSGILEASNGVVSALPSISVSRGGTGTTTLPSYGQLLLGNADGSYDLVATSTLGISSSGSSILGTTGQLAYFSGTDTAVGTSTLFISSGGNVGVGTETPTHSFQVVGNTLIGEDITSAHYSTASLSVANSAASSFRTQLNIINAGGGVDTGTGIDFFTYDYAGSVAPEARLSTIDDGNYSNSFVFSTKVGGDPTNSLVERFRIGSDGNVGIGTTTPYGLLSLNPNGITGPAFVIGSSTATQFTVTSEGNVGIGKTSPSFPLDVVGSIRSSGSVYADSGVSINTNSTIVFDQDGDGFAKILTDGNNDYGYGVNSSIFTSTNGVFAFENGDAGVIPIVLMDASTGYVGIGTANPNSLLHIFDGRFRVESGGGSIVEISDDLVGAVAGIHIDDGSVKFSDGNFTVDGEGNSYFAGNVGIGSTTPSAKFAITGSGTGTGQAFVIANSSNSQKFTVLDNGAVGIGSGTVPSQTLEIFGNGTTNGAESGKIRLGNGASGATFTWDIFRDGSDGLLTFYGNQSGADGVRFSGASGEKMRLTPGGNLGIGTASPGAKLEVSGDIYLSSGASRTIKMGASVANTKYDLTLQAQDAVDSTSNAGGDLYLRGGNNWAAGSVVPGGNVYVVAGRNTFSNSLNGDVIFQAGASNVERMRMVGDTGNLGIGTTTPYGLLSVNPNGITGPSFVVGSSTATQFVVSNGGNVGIGKENPSSTFHVAVGGQDLFRVDNTSDGKMFLDSTGPHAQQLTFVPRDSSDGNSRIYSNTDLHILGGGQTYLGNQDDTMIRLVDGSNELLFNSGGSEFMRVSNGGLGIGSSTPWGKLSVTNTGTGPSFVVEDSSSPDSSPFIIDASGNVGVGTSTLESKFGLVSDSTSKVSQIIRELPSQTADLLQMQDSSGNVRMGWNSSANSLYLGNGTADSSAWISIVDSVASAKSGIKVVKYTSGSALDLSASAGDVITATGSGAFVRFTQSNTGTSFANAYYDAASFDIRNDFDNYATRGLYVKASNQNASPSSERARAYGIYIEASNAATGNGGAAVYASALTSNVHTFWGKLAASQSAHAIRIDNSSDVNVFNINATGGGYFAGSLGIGTTTPGSLLSVGNTNGINFSTATSTFSSTGGINLAAGCFAVNGVCVGSGGSSQWTTTGSDIYYNTGNVGIANASPSNKLDIIGNARIQSGKLILGDQVRDDSIDFYGNQYTMGLRGYTLFAKSPQMFRYESGVSNSAYNAFEIGTSGGSTFLAVNNSGNLGIGTTTPYGLLSVNPNGITGPSFVVGSSTATSLIVTNAGNVGVGILSPTSRFEVSGNSSSTAFSMPVTASSVQGVMNMGSNRFLHAYTTASLFAGVESGNFTTSGSYNTGLGYQSLMNISSGHSNVAVGPTAGKGISSGVRNIAIGYAAIGSGSDGGTDNVSIGYGSMSASSVTGTGNTAVGGGSSRALYGGTGNTTVGYASGDTINAGSRNTFLGYYAGYSTTGSNNVIVGSDSGGGLTSGGNNIMIGYDIDASTAAMSNVLNIGNIIFGTGIDGTGTTLSSGNIGIGTTTPWRKLSVTGSVGFDGVTGSTGAGSLCLSSTNEVVYNSGSDSCLPSLRETKHDITDLQMSASDVISALNSVSFVYNTDTSSTLRYGFIAEDAALVDPHLATYDASGNISGIDDRSIISVLVKAFKELKVSVDGMLTWFGGDKFTVQSDVCVDDVCVTKEEFKQILLNNGGANPVTPSPDPEPTPAPEPDPEPTPDPETTPTPDPEPVVTDPVSDPAPEPAPVPEEEPAPEPIPESEPTSDPAPEPVL